ncbi:hypothetical protein MJO28_004718 [Puccinia striiformis f. sp. tritici]|uniref:Uncharacterized protein n=1 Tax=Puccinia striiformis f. sp. tritici TaxID=168172 RepID=A0ACC0EI92_9BASI|nr:hypothetical protein MJO28_004718 [Puccinia striiformis f. sp. tritici]KAI7959748.1 hypothetical protein MJO29_004816 [Puccinia striiformis f. sp. tritici]
MPPIRLKTGVTMLPTAINQLLRDLPLRRPTSFDEKSLSDWRKGIYGEFPISFIHLPPMHYVLVKNLDDLSPLLTAWQKTWASNVFKKVAKPIMYLQLWLKLSHKPI